MVQVMDPRICKVFGMHSVPSNLNLPTAIWTPNAIRWRSTAHFGGRKAFPRLAGDGAASSHAPPLVSSLWRVVRIGNGHPGQYLRSPFLKLSAKVGRSARFAFVKVVLFSNVVGQVVQFTIATAIKVLNQFPVSFP